MAEIGDWFNQIPLVTRHWFAASVVVPILCRFNVFSPYSMILTPDFMRKFALWKPITSVLYYPIAGNKGFQFLMNLYFIYNYSQRLETGHFAGRQADYVFMILFNWLSLVGLAWSFGIMMLMDPMVMSVLYVYCMLNQDQIVTFWFGTRFKARYLPWALFGLSLIMGGSALDLAGILAGHLYYFVMIKYPADQGVVLVRTPAILYRYFPGGASAAAPTVPPTQPLRPNQSTQASSTGYNWGRGRRLED